MDICWRLARDDGALDFGAALLPKEIFEGRRYRHAGRHRQWQHGRHLAKHLLREEADRLELPALHASELWIRRRQSGAPQVLSANGRPLPVHLSISHRDVWAAVAACPESRGPIGVDLERVEPRSDVFVQDYFSERERTIVATGPEAARDLRINLLWSIKEAVLKALGTGLAEPTGRVEVIDLTGKAEDGWRPAQVRLDSDAPFHVVWRKIGKDQVLSLARIERF